MFQLGGPWGYPPFPFALSAGRGSGTGKTPAPLAPGMGIEGALPPAGLFPFAAGPLGRSGLFPFPPLTDPLAPTSAFADPAQSGFP